MSLDNIQLPATVVQELFNNSLVDLKSMQCIETKEKTPKSNAIEMLGHFQKRILIVVDEPDEKYLSESKLNFIINILTACKLNMDDVGILNYQSSPTLEYSTIQAQLQPSVLLIFGPKLLQSLQFPIACANFQIQPYHNQRWVVSMPLNAMQEDKTNKLLLWNCLKELFSI